MKKCCTARIFFTSHIFLRVLSFFLSSLETVTFYDCFAAPLLDKLLNRFPISWAILIIFIVRFFVIKFMAALNCGFLKFFATHLNESKDLILILIKTSSLVGFPSEKMNDEGIFCVFASMIFKDRDSLTIKFPTAN